MTDPAKTSAQPAAQVRGFVPSDLPAMYDICLRTGDAGQDASGRYADPFLVGHVYAGPYPIADPGLTFLGVDALGVVGYTVATADARQFDRWRSECWYPALRQTYPLAQWPDGLDGDRVRQIHSPEPLAEDPELHDRYPAELHIDLLPRAQGQGLGRALTERLWQALRERGVPGVHLGVGAANTNAQSFYRHLGYQVFREQPWGTVMVKDLR